MQFEKERMQIKEWKVTHDFDAYFNGCGSGWFVSKCENVFLDACKVHDFLYIKKKFKRSICDKIFLEEMLAVSTSITKKLQAYLFYFLVRIFGWVWYYKLV